MRLCPFCNETYDESKYYRCPYCSGKAKDEIGERHICCPVCDHDMIWNGIWQCTYCAHEMDSENSDSFIQVSGDQVTFQNVQRRSLRFI